MANDLLRTRICIACNGQFSDEPCEPSECDIRRIIENFDPETLRPKGRWKLNRDGSGTCSECHRTRNDVWDMDNWDNFCSHCGADMRGERDAD